MTAGNLLRFLRVGLICLILWQAGAGAVRAADRSKRTASDEQNEATLRHLFGPRPELAPLRIERASDTGPATDRDPEADHPEGMPLPLDAFQPGQQGTAADPRPFRVPPPAAELFEPSPARQAYECDSFKGRASEILAARKWLPFAALWPFSNGESTWVAGTGNTLGFVELEKRFLFAKPSHAPFRIIPGLMTRYVSGPDTTDLPPTLNEFSIELAATYELGEVWTLDAGFRPSLNSDLSYVDGESFRWLGHAVFARQVSATTQGVLGFVYLDREDIPALPVVGWVWQPHPGVKMEMVFPRPRLAVALGQNPEACGWAYVKGELGGNSWTIERANGAHDVATYRDLRLIVGYETPFTAGIAAQIETGWVTSRKLMYESGDPDFTPSDTFLIRAGFCF